MKNPNPKPLREAIAAAEQNRAAAVALEKDRLGFVAEIEAFLANGDPNDAQRLQEIGSTEVKAKMMPNIIKRRDEEFPALVTKVAAELESFERELCEAGAAEKEAVTVQIETYLKLAAPDEEQPRGATPFNRARSLAAHCAVVQRPPVSRDQFNALGWPRVEFQGDDPQRSYQAARERAGFALALYDLWSKQGGFNPPQVLKFYGVKL